jgi:hypothetical protein
MPFDFCIGFSFRKLFYHFAGELDGRSAGRKPLEYRDQFISESRDRERAAFSHRFDAYARYLLTVHKAAAQRRRLGKPSPLKKMGARWAWT